MLIATNYLAKLFGTAQLRVAKENQGIVICHVSMDIFISEKIY